MEQSSSSSSSSIDMSADWFCALSQDEQEDVRRFQENDPTLTVLNLWGNSIGDEGAAAIGKALETNKTLKQLNLFSNSIGDEGAAAIGKALEKNKTLTKLVLGFNSIGDNGVSAIGKALEKNKTLTKLVLGFNSIGDNGVSAIGKVLAMNTTLTVLDLNSNSIGFEGAAAIGKALETNETLKELYLDSNSIGDEGAVAFGKALETNKALTVLYLYKNSIGDKGAVAIGKALEKNKTLTELYLNNNSIGDKGAVAIGKALETNQTLASNLQRLDLSNNDITRLPRSFVKLEGTCEYFNVIGNPLLEPPSEVAEQGLEAIARYFEAVDKGGAITSRQLKAVLVGDGEAGKTSLRNAIAGRFPARTEGEEERTIYLNVEPVQIDAPEGLSDDPITLMVYDCGGQQDYAVGQAPFMTASSLFLLVVAADKAHDDCYEDVVHRFLVLLQARAPGAVVQLVLSKVDLVPDELDEAERKQWLEERVRWLNDKVQGQLQAWRNAAAIREREQVALQDRVIAEDDSMERKKPPLLRILPNVLKVSVTSRSAIAGSQEQVSNTIFRHTQDHAEPRLSSVGTLIPKSWQELWKFFGAVLQCGTDADEEALFSVASSDDAIPLGEIGNMKTTTDGEMEIPAKGPYCSVKRLKSLWNKFRFLHSPLADDTTFGDALGLLEARGSIFVDAGLAYLQPSFVTDLIKPLIDHTLTPEKIESSEFGKEVETFVEICESKRIGLRQDIMEGLRDLTRSGELDALILPFLWRDFKIDQEDYRMILQMLLESDVVFASSPHPNSSTKEKASSRVSADVIPVVLFRLKKEIPSDWEDMWPERVPDEHEQRDLRFIMYRGCPTSLTAHFAAATHAYGNCVCACLNGAIVLDEKDRYIRSKLVEIDGGEPYLVFSVRYPKDDALREEIWGLLNGAVSFARDEVKDHFAGLQYDVVFACHCCVSAGRGQDSQLFGWSKVTNPDRRMSSHFCRNCRKNINFRVGEPIHNKIGRASRHKELLNQMMARVAHFPEAQEIGHDADGHCIQSPLADRKRTSDELSGPDASTNTAGERNVSGLYTQTLMDGIKTDVGELSMDEVPDPSSVWQVNLGGDPYVFLSHRGIDTKESIARPTRWFLTKRMGVKTFMDDGSLKTGEDQMHSLLEAAHTCSHAVIILSPKFLESRYCVMELNTFMMRRKRKNLKILSYLWKLDEVDRFAEAVKRMIYLEARIDDPARYLVGRLWPDLIERLKCDRDKPEWDDLSLKDELVRYVEEHRVDETTPPIPKSLEVFAHNIGPDKA